MDAYLEEELYDILTYCIQNPSGSDFEMKKKRAEEIGSGWRTRCNGEYVLFN
jgi:hypothetical protein